MRSCCYGAEISRRVRVSELSGGGERKRIEGRRAQARKYEQNPLIDNVSSLSYARIVYSERIKDTGVIMVFRGYTNVISQATKSFARGTLLLGLFLIGFGVLILALPAVFAFLAAMVFFIGGFGAVITAIKMYLANRKMEKLNSDGSEGYRENVQVRIEEHDEF